MQVIVPIVTVPDLPHDGLCPWTADVIYLRAGLTAERRAWVLAHEREHVRQARRFPTADAWRKAYEAADTRGSFHNTFEHEANLAAFTFVFANAA